MRLSLATRIFLGHAVVLLTFGAVSIFSVAEMHRNQQEIRLVSQGYLHLSQDTAAIETFHKNQEKETERLLQQAPETRQALMRLARVYFPPLMVQRINAGRQKAHALLEFAPESEKTFIQGLADKFVDLHRRYGEYEEATGALYSALETLPPDSPEVTAKLDLLNQKENAIGYMIRVLHAALENRIRERVDNAVVRERRTGIAIIALSVVAIGVGLLATAISARSLRPVRTLTEGVARIGRGDYSAQLGIRGDDEIAQLAREFDTMAKSLQEREAQLREKQEMLLRAEQLAAVGRVSAQVAHEVRNPLSSIGLNVELLQEAVAKAEFKNPGLAQEAADLLSAVTHEVDRLTEITEEYLRMARLPKPNPTSEDVGFVVQNVLDFARNELERAQIRVTKRFASKLPRVHVDEAQLRQVFLNLVRNSKEAMPEGGELEVSVRPVDGDVEIAFADTGRGIPASLRDKIFEPFFSTKEGGTGLGLAVSQQILKAHGGTIRCESEGLRTTFVLRLPATPGDLLRSSSA